MKQIGKRILASVLKSFLVLVFCYWNSGFSGNTIKSNEIDACFLLKSTDMSSGDILFRHVNGKDTYIGMDILGKTSDIKPQVFPYPADGRKEPLSGVSVSIEETKESPVKTGMIWADDPEDLLYSLSLTLPASMKSGFYRVSLGCTYPYAVRRSSSDKIGLYCPDGFWSALRQNGLSDRVEGVPYYFYVPSNLQNLQLFLGRPHTVKNSRGRVVLDSSSYRTGNVTLPVRRQGGIWSIEPAFYGNGRLGTAPPSFARLLNVEPVVSFASPARLPVISKKAQARKKNEAPETTDKGGYVRGISGSGLLMEKDRSLSFKRGMNLKDGGYSFFPSRKGTIEFWFKPGWSSFEIPISRQPFISKCILRSPHINLNYLYGGRNWNRQIYSDLQMEILTDTKEVGIPGKGKQETCFFSAGKWVHMAFTWNLWKVSEGSAKLPPSEIIKGSVEWPAKWRIFGPLDSSDEKLPERVLNSMPEEITVSGKSLKGTDVAVEKNLYDFPSMLKNEPTGKNAYVFIPFNSPKDQKVTLGMGADWWMQAWVNGILVHDTMQSSNIYFPFSIWNYTVDVDVKKGRNILAVRFIRGGGSELALGGPDQLRKTPLPPKPGEEKPKDGMEGEFGIFVDGRKLVNTRGLIREPFLVGIDGWEIFGLSEKEEEVSLCPVDGTVDTLRISDSVRYTDNFEPLKTDPAMDENTRALFLFEGNLKGISAFSRDPIVAR